MPAAVSEAPQQRGEQHNRSEQSQRAGRAAGEQVALAGHLICRLTRSTGGTAWHCTFAASVLLTGAAVGQVVQGEGERLQAAACGVVTQLVDLRAEGRESCCV